MRRARVTRGGAWKSPCICHSRLNRFGGNDVEKVLIADDDPALRGLLRLVARRAGFEVDVASNGSEALEKIRDNEYLIAVIDLMMPRVSGYEVIERLAEMDRRPGVVVVTAMNDAHIPRLNSEVVQSILRKPFDIEMLSAVLTELAETMRARKQSRGDNVVNFPGQTC